MTAALLNKDEYIGDVIRDLSVRIYSDNSAKGFWDVSADEQSTIKLSKIALIHGEYSEAVEAIRKDAMDDHLSQYPGEWVEMADGIIRSLDYCGAYSIPIGQIILEKLEYNRSRPYKHGKGC